MSHKIAALKIFCEITQKPIVNIVKGAVSSLRQFLATESPWKIMKNTFYFILTNWICYWQIRLCTYYVFSLNRMSDICEVWKYCPLKDGQGHSGPPFCGWWTKNLQTFSRHFFQEQPSKYCIVEFTATFVCFLLNW